MSEGLCFRGEGNSSLVVYPARSVAPALLQEWLAPHPVPPFPFVLRVHKRPRASEEVRPCGAAAAALAAFAVVGSPVALSPALCEVLGAQYPDALRHAALPYHATILPDLSCVWESHQLTLE